MITKSERAELRSIVKQQFRVLRAEVEEREAEMSAQVDEEIAARFAADDEKWTAVQHKIQEIVLAANREVNDAIYEAGYVAREQGERQFVGCAPMRKPDQGRMELRRVAASRVKARVKSALLALDRQEADLLRTLAVDALESAEAREFLSAIPTAGELVPVARLAELEVSLSDEAD